jgi:hypothetical protein
VVLQRRLRHSGRPSHVHDIVSAPSDRPSAAAVLKHPWFQHRPSLAPVDGPSREEAEAAYALHKAEHLKKWNVDESSVIWSGFLPFWLSLKQKAGGILGSGRL